MKTKTLRIALIGAGAMGMRWAAVLHGFRGAQFVAVADINPERARLAEECYGVPGFSDTNRMLRRIKPDVCVVVVPHDALAPVAIQALGAGIHVLLEKPGGRTARELSAVLAVATRRRKQVMMGYNYRRFPGPAAAKAIIDAGKIGAVMFIRGRHGFGGRKGYDKTWRHDKKISGGGHLIDQGAHLIDLARWFAGDVRAAGGALARSFWKSEVEDNAFVLLRHAKGAVSSIHASVTQWNPLFSFEVYGTKGYVAIEGLGKKYGGQERVIVGKRTPDFSFVESSAIECDPDADKALGRELTAFIDAIRHRRPPHPSIADGIAVLKVVESIYKEDKF